MRGGKLGDSGLALPHAWLQVMLGGIPIIWQYILINNACARISVSPPTTHPAVFSLPGDTEPERRARALLSVALMARMLARLGSRLTVFSNDR